MLSQPSPPPPTPLRYAVFNWIYREEDRHNKEEPYPWYFTPRYMHNETAFHLHPQEMILVTFSSHDGLYRLQVCCNTIQTYCQDQLCMAIYNTSMAMVLHVPQKTTLADLLATPLIDHRMVAASMSDIIDLGRNPHCQQAKLDDTSTAQLPAHHYRQQVKITTTTNNKAAAAAAAAAGEPRGISSKLAGQVESRPPHDDDDDDGKDRTEEEQLTVDAAAAEDDRAPSPPFHRVTTPPPSFDDDDVYVDVDDVADGPNSNSKVGDDEEEMEESYPKRSSMPALSTPSADTSSMPAAAAAAAAAVVPNTMASLPVLTSLQEEDQLKPCTFFMKRSSDWFKQLKGKLDSAAAAAAADAGPTGT